MVQLTLRLALFLGAYVSLSTSFVSRTSNRPSRAWSTASYALTERQLQFWEDVDGGLNDIENFFAKEGQDIDRVRQFAKRYVRTVCLLLASLQFFDRIQLSTFGWGFYSLFSSVAAHPARFHLQRAGLQATSLPKNTWMVSPPSPFGIHLAKRPCSHGLRN